jgi:hypothetical protein
MVPITEGAAAALGCGVAGGADAVAAGVSAGRAEFPPGLGSGGAFSHDARAPRAKTKAVRNTKERWIMVAGRLVQPFSDANGYAKARALHG